MRKLIAYDLVIKDLEADYEIIRRGYKTTPEYLKALVEYIKKFTFDTKGGIK